MLPHINNKLKNTLYLLVLLLAAGWISYSAFNMVKQMIDINQEYASNSYKIKELAQEKANLENQIKNLQTDAAAERIAKDKLNLKRPGENLIIIVPSKNATSSQENSSPSFWQKIVDFFKGL